MIAALAPRAFAVFERNVRVYRRQWLMIVTGFFEPLFEFTFVHSTGNKRPHI